MGSKAQAPASSTAVQDEESTNKTQSSSATSEDHSHTALRIPALPILAHHTTSQQVQEAGTNNDRGDRDRDRDRDLCAAPGKRDRTRGVQDYKSPTPTLLQVPGLKEGG